MMLRGSNLPRFAGHDMSTREKIFLKFLWRVTDVSVLSDCICSILYLDRCNQNRANPTYYQQIIRNPLKKRRKRDIMYIALL